MLCEEHFLLAPQKVLGSSLNLADVGRSSTSRLDQTLACFSVRFLLTFNFVDPGSSQCASS